MACVIGCVSGENPLGTLSLPATLPGLLEAAGENGGIGIEQAWVLILPCFLLVCSKTFFFSEPHFFICILGRPAQLPAWVKGRAQERKWLYQLGVRQGRGKGAWDGCPQSPSGGLDAGSPIGMKGGPASRTGQVRGLRTVGIVIAAPLAGRGLGLGGWSVGLRHGSSTAEPR